MSSDPLIDIIPIMKREQDGQIVTQFDYPACESLGLIKMDFLGLRNLTIISDALDNIKTNRGHRPRPRGPGARRPRARTSCSRAATPSASSSSTAGRCAALLRLMKPDNFEDISAVIALYRPGPMGANSHTNYALRKNGLQAITPIHPELEEPLQGHPRHDLRPDHLPGAGHGDRAEGRRVLPRPGGHPPPRDGQEEEVRARQAVRGLRAGHERQRLLGRGDQDALGHPAAVLRLRVQQGALGRVRRGVATGPRTSRRTTRPSTWPRCSRASATPATSSRSTSTSAAAWASRCCRRTSTSRSASSPPSATTSASAWAPSATSGSTSSTTSSRPGPRRARFESFHDFLRKVPISSANKRTVESLIKAGAFDSLGDTRRALVEIHEGAVEAAVKVKRDEANGNVGLRLRLAVRRGRRGRRECRGVAGAGPPGVVQARQARVRARHARALRLRPPARRARDRAREAPVDHHRRPARRPTTRSRARPVTRRRAADERAAPRGEDERQPVRHRRRSRTSAARSA